MRRTAVIAGSFVAVLAAGGVLAVSGGAQATAGRRSSSSSGAGSEKFVDVPPRAKRAFSASAGDTSSSHPRSTTARQACRHA